MKISRNDRYQALMRSQRYFEDFQSHFKKPGDKKEWAIGTDPHNLFVRLSDEAKRLCKKWKIRYPLDPARHYEDKFIFSVVDPAISYLEFPETWNSEIKHMGWIKSDGEVDKDNSLITHVKDKLVLMIDTSRSCNELEMEFRVFLDRWIDRPSRRSRVRETDDIWEIYDRHKKYGESLIQITRDRFDIEDKPDNRPICNDKVMAQYRKIQRASKKASDIIRYIEKEAESRLVE